MWSINRKNKFSKQRIMVQRRERERDYVSHEFLDILGVVSESVHKNNGNGHINPELGNLQNSLRSSQRWHFFGTLKTTTKSIISSNKTRPRKEKNPSLAAKENSESAKFRRERRRLGYLTGGFWTKSKCFLFQLSALESQYCNLHSVNQIFYLFYF